MLLRCATVIQVLNDQNTLIVKSILQNMVIPSSPSSMLNLLLWLGTDTIINAYGLARLTGSRFVQVKWI